ncbi:unnamed protein product, partial [Oncorhynchus mykiss]
CSAIDQVPLPVFCYRPGSHSQCSAIDQVPLPVFCYRPGPTPMTRVTPDLYPPIPLSRSVLNKAFRDHTEQQHIAAQQEAALQHAHTHSSGFFITQDSSFGNLILPVLPQPDPPSAAVLQNL